MDESILEGIEKCMQNIGLSFDREQNDLSAYIEDSISFISFIVELEQYFKIEVTDDYFSSDRLNTINKVCLMIEELSHKNEKA